MPSYLRPDLLPQRRDEEQLAWLTDKKHHRQMDEAKFRRAKLAQGLVNHGLDYFIQANLLRGKISRDYVEQVRANLSEIVDNLYQTFPDQDKLRKLE